MFSRLINRALATLVALLAVGVMLVSPARADSEESQQGSVVVIGIGGLTWNEVTEETAPNLYAFASEGASANVVVRTTKDTTCPMEGWLTISAGQRATDYRRVCRIPGLAGGVVTDWQSLRQANKNGSYGAVLGRLGDAVDEPVAIGVGAAVALAESDGRVPEAYVPVKALPGSVAGTDAGDPDEARSKAADAYREHGGQASLTVVDLGSVRYPNSKMSNRETRAKSTDFWEKLRSSFDAVGRAPEEVMQQVGAADARFAELLAAIRETTPDATIIVTSVADSQQNTAQLGYFVISGPRAGEGVSTATSAATRQSGLVQLTDVFPTVLRWALPESRLSVTAIGSVVEFTGHTTDDVEAAAAHKVALLRDSANRSTSVRPLIGPFYLTMGFMLVVVAVMARLRRAGRFSNRAFFEQVSLWVACLPVASLLVNLLPWWRSGNAAATLFVGIASIAAVMAAASLGLRKMVLARRGPEADPASAPVHPRYIPLLVVGSVTAIVLAVDVLVDTLLPGFPMQLGSLMGTQPQVGGRFYGFSNGTFAMFAAGLTVALAVLGESMRARGRARLGVGIILGIGVAAIFVDGSARFGADFGGPPVLVVAVALLVLMVLGKRLTVWKFLGVLALAAAVSLSFAYIDYLHPPARRSHLGRFIQSMVDGDAWAVIARKISLLLFGLPWVYALAAAALVALVLVVLWRRGSYRRLSEWLAGDLDAIRMGVIALLTALAVGMVINDSGMVVPFVGLIVALPLWCVAADQESEQVSA